MPGNSTTQRWGSRLVERGPAGQAVERADGHAVSLPPNPHGVYNRSQPNGNAIAL
jgi:hypothetical protein